MSDLSKQIARALRTAAVTASVCYLVILVPISFLTLIASAIAGISVSIIIILGSLTLASIALPIAAHYLEKAGLYSPSIVASSLNILVIGGFFFSFYID